MSRYLFGPFVLDPARRVLTRDDAPVPITGKAFDVLLALIERRGRTVEKDELLTLVWADATVQEANLSQQIFTIRRILGENPDYQRCIATIPRRGYQFVAEVRDWSEPAMDPSAMAGLAPVPRPASPMRLALHLPPGAGPALSPSGALVVDRAGRFLVYVSAAGGTSRLFVRAFDRLDPQPVSGTDGAANPFLSPDGEWIGYLAQGRLQKVRVSGGVPSVICEVDGDIRGAAWTSRGEIVFAPGPASGLSRVAAAGGTPRVLTVLAFDEGERTHRWPHALPDGAHVILTIGHAGAASFDEATLAVVSLSGDGTPRPILRHGTDARYAPSGHLLYAREASVMAAPFDAGALAVRGAARPLIAGVATAATGAAHFDCSATGILVHAPGSAQTVRRRLVRMARDGSAATPEVAGDGLEEPRVSPDGRRAVVGLRGRTTDVWQYDFARGTLARLTFDGDNFAAVWGPWADSITFSSNRGGVCDLYTVKTGELPRDELLLASAYDKVPGSWSPDGTRLLYTEYHPDTGADLWIFDRAAGEARPLVRTRFNEYGPAVSLDGRCVAYTSDESGRPEVHVAGLSGHAGKWQISTDGGFEPVWSRDGAELFYRCGDRLMSVDMRRGPSDAGVPATLFEGPYLAGSLTGLPNYDVAADGASFLFVSEEHVPPPPDLLVTIDCFSHLG